MELLRSTPNWALEELCIKSAVDVNAPIYVLAQSQASTRPSGMKHEK